ncbi:phage tail tube protein [Cupriavidus sp. 2TAF22]|uniref:phage tail tube protein n=1 Tax=unclassified Cupriavidus TaxID=2640874 RepID=UPI003F911F08
MGQKIAGTVYVKADGTQFDCQGAGEAPITKYKRESIRPGMIKEEDLVPYIKADMSFTKDFPLTKLQDAIDMVVTIEFKNGKTYVLTGAYVVGEPSAAGDDGKVSLEFNGVEGKWQ